MWFHPSYCLTGVSPLPLDMGYLFLVNSIFTDTGLVFIRKVGRIFENYNLRRQRKYNISVQISGFIKVMTVNVCSLTSHLTDTRAKRNCHQGSEISVLVAQSDLYHLRSQWWWKHCLLWRVDANHTERPVDLKTIHNLKLRVMFYSVGIFRTSGMGDVISSDPERTVPRRQGEKPDYIDFTTKGR